MVKRYGGEMEDELHKELEEYAESHNPSLSVNQAIEKAVRLMLKGEKHE